MARSRLLLLALPFALVALGCGGSTQAQNDGGSGDDAQADAPPGDDVADGALPPPAPVGKLDILFMIDNSASMGDKQALLQATVPDMIGRLVNPDCVDSQGNVVGTSQNGQCAQGHLEFQPVHDMHIGIVTSSLGGRGGDQCSATETNPANPTLNAHADDQGHLIDRGGADEHVVTDASPTNFLAWFPSVPQNQGQPPPPVVALGDPAKLIGDSQDMVSGVHEHGCGFEAQLESWYRFLVQPDPFASITLNGTRASLQGTDATIVQQRHDFLRPDSAVAIIVITDENEEVVDPMLFGGQGWAYANTQFPGSPIGTAPEGTIECQSNPLDPNCTSCAFIQTDPNFATRCPKDGQNGANGYLDPMDDQLNVRGFHPKQRFGVFTQDPVSRYVTGLTSTKVPDRAHEHDAMGNYIGDSNANCTNPLFAASLPTDPNADLCNLPLGPRTPSQVFYAAIVGVPHQLLQSNPSDPNSPQKATLSAADWTVILGKDPLDYDFTGADFHMLESVGPRAQSSCPPASADDCDPMNGREWNTNKGDLQFACVFDLPAPKDCTVPQYAGACDCATGALDAQTPLCQKDANGNYTTTQIRGKAYPSIRELAVARALGGRSVVSSICPIHTTEAMPGDPLFGYRPAMQGLIDRLATTLQK